MPAPYCYLNGQLVPEREAVVPISELGTQLIYDTARTYGGQPKLLAYHLERVWDGVRYFGFDLGLAPADLERAIRQTLAANVDPDFVAQGGDYLISLKLSGTPLVCITTPSLLPLFRSRARYFRTGIAAVVARGAAAGITRISAGNYGGKLGPFHFRLHALAAQGEAP